MVVADLEAFAPLATDHFALTGVVAGIFEGKWGGGGGAHCVKPRILTSFRQLNINIDINPPPSFPQLCPCLTVLLR